MTTSRTTVDKVMRRLGTKNIDSDIDEETISEYINDVSAYIERQSNKQTFGTLDNDLVESIATDLACARVLKHMAGGMFYGGADYRLGPWTTMKTSGGRQLLELAREFERSAREQLKVLGNYSSFRFAVG